MIMLLYYCAAVSVRSPKSVEDDPMLDLGNVHFYRDDSANWVRKLKSFFCLCFLLVEPKDTKGGPHKT